MFDEESNPYASTPTSSSSSTSQLQIQLPVSSLNTLKPTISLPSLDDAEDSSGGGINLPTFEMASSSGFGGAGWGGAGWGNSSNGFGGGGGGNDAFGSSPFDTITGNSSSGFGGFGIKDDGLTTPSASATLRSNPFNQSNSTSWDQGGSGAVDGFGESPFDNEDDGGGQEQDTWGKNRSFGGAAARGSANGFSFGGGGGAKFTSTQREEERETTPTESTFNQQDLSIPASVSSPSLPSSTFSSTSTNLEPPPSTQQASFGNLNRRRADTAPSSRPPPNSSTFVSDPSLNGGYPPLGAGLPRTSSHQGGGLPRSNPEEDGDPSPLPTLNEDSSANRPFGSGFKFGGGAQSQALGRERAATMLSSTSAPGLAGENVANRPFRFGGGANQAVETNVGERKRSGSDGRRQGLKVELTSFLSSLSHLTRD